MIQEQNLTRRPTNQIEEHTATQHVHAQAKPLLNVANTFWQLNITHTPDQRTIKGEKSA